MTEGEDSTILGGTGNAELMIECPIKTPDLNGNDGERSTLIKTQLSHTDRKDKVMSSSTVLEVSRTVESTDSSSFDNIFDEDLLRTKLEESTDFEVRRLIRARLRHLKKSAESSNGQSQPSTVPTTMNYSRYQTAENRRSSLSGKSSADCSQPDLSPRANGVPKVELKSTPQQVKPQSRIPHTELPEFKLRSTPKTAKSSSETTSAGLPKVELKLTSKQESSLSTPKSPQESVILQSRKSSEENVRAGDRKVKENPYSSIILRKVEPDIKVTSPSPAKSKENNVRQSTASARARFKEMDGVAVTKSGVDTAEMDKRRSPSPNTIRDQMLAWCQHRLSYYENVDVTDFSSSWNNGLAFCALVHSYFPHAFDYDELKPSNRRENFTLAFKMAEKHAGVFALLDVDDMVATLNPDWKCVFTYVNSLANELRDAAKKLREENGTSNGNGIY